MRFLKRSLLIATLINVFAVNACAANTEVYACQYEKTGGLDWTNGAWTLRNFNNPKPFFLKLEQGKLSEESVGAALGSYRGTLPVHCFVDRHKSQRQGCMNELGETLYFDSKNSTGSVAALFGGTVAGTSRDSVYVGTFSCQKM